MILALPLIFMRLLLRSRRFPAYRQRLLERLGVYLNFHPKKHGLWIHAVSVGEVVAALPLIKALQQKYVHLPITVTTTTPTGSQRVKQSLGNTVEHVYMPYDIPWALNNLIKKLQPSCLIIMETELWPNVLEQCVQHSIPVIIANGRISVRSFSGYMRFRWFIKNVLQQISFVAAQSQTDAMRFIQLGMPDAKVSVAGNLKFEVQKNDLQQQLGRELRATIPGRFVWVAASTHFNEEEQVLQAFEKIQQYIPECLLILIPRHPDRFDMVAQLLQKSNLSFITRSSGAICSSSTKVILGDTMGELTVFYAAADIAFVGGSLVPIGGHNLLEPAVLGTPTLTGPHMENFKDITKLLIDAGAVSMVHNSDELAQFVIKLLGQPELLQKMGDSASLVVAKNLGAVDAICQHLEQGKYFLVPASTKS